MYADDLVLISKSKEGLQRQIDCLNVYCKTWKLKINTKKTKCMVFNRGSKVIKADFRIEGVQSENVKSFTYLGCTMSAKNCQFQPTIDDLKYQGHSCYVCYKIQNQIFPITNKTSYENF